MPEQTTDDTDDGESYLERLGANTREPADTINVGVSGTVGPDYLGQESVDVDGHSCDRPGVRNRLPDGDPATDPVLDPDCEKLSDPLIAEMDTGRELPVLLSSSMSTDPIEGTQGSFTRIVEGECARCGYDRLRESVQTMAGECQRTCNACGATQDRRADNGYRMPQTDGERADKMRSSGDEIGQAGRFDVYDMEDSGMGPYLHLINGDSLTLLDKETPFELYWTAISRTDAGTALRALEADLEDALDGTEKILLAHALTPDGVEFSVDEGDQGKPEGDNE